MIHPYQILLPLLSLFWVRVDLTDLLPIRVPVEIVDIMDGDTLTVMAGRTRMRVRLSKIDAPEIGQRFHLGAADAGVASRKCLRNLVPEKSLLVIEGFDIYHRTLGDVGGLNLQSIKHGCGGLYPHATFSSIREKMLFLRMQTEAKRNRRGLWSRGGYMVPKKWRRISKRSGSRSSHSRGHSRVTYRPARRSG